MSALLEKVERDSVKTMDEQRNEKLEEEEKRRGEQRGDVSRELVLGQFHYTHAYCVQSRASGQPAMSLVVNQTYSPSTTELCDLKPMLLSELRHGTNHTGRVLIVRTIEQPVRHHCVQSVVEDQNSNLDMINVYHTILNIDPAYVLPKDTIFAVKEPFYKTLDSKGATIRVDHPSDIICLRSSHPMVPIKLTAGLPDSGQDALALKTKGNASFKSKDYLSALDSYTRGLEACGEADDRLRCDLYRNRAIVNTHLGRYERAVKDAKAAIIPDYNSDQVSKKKNVTAFFRAGRALYELRNFSDAKVQFTKLLNIMPSDEDTQKYLAKTEARITESETGHYDIPAIVQASKKPVARLDLGSFTKNVVVRHTQKRGNGLFATKDIKSGEIILVEKAYAICFNAEAAQGNDEMSILDVTVGRMRVGAGAEIWYQAVQKAMHNPNQAGPIYHLHDGGYTPKHTPQEVDGIATVDTFRVGAILAHNCFETQDDAVGLWPVTSFANHACDANAMHKFMGDIVIMRATKDIKKGQEVMIRYRNPKLDQMQTRHRFELTWKFTCDCPMCTLESETPAAQLKERQALIKEVEALIENPPPGSSKNMSGSQSRALINKAENLCTKLEATYDMAVFANRPRLALAYLRFWLVKCLTGDSVSELQKRLDLDNQILRDCGNKVTIKGQKLTIDSTNSHLMMDTPNVALDAATACFMLGKMELRKQYSAFAKEKWMILNEDESQWMDPFETALGMMGGESIRAQMELAATLAR